MIVSIEIHKELVSKMSWSIEITTTDYNRSAALKWNTTQKWFVYLLLSFINSISVQYTFASL